ncbi:putative BRCT domain-containing protein [Rosa chinensis]|uniref:Putative BRCT domain-containing protein n=1 Tax=Rosa chinensis TaxID=74649 RepID=A0A2P6SAK1_ROSCH|nr:uncharacterized protein LOC112187276 isoform X1 [Rosa chinensis]XP_024181792.1 uncharacterized protein LOC112187276 isoform X2 [Rosa chinensis]PRQ55704.1 putative BRCT domain-containing protein [Rosa chinensis]
MAHHPINTLGFRPPQFSEDLAWLPGWLQQHQIEQFDECIEKLKGTNLELECKDLKVSQGKNSKGNYADTLSREEDRNKSYHLFLSGEDNTPAGFSSSPGNVLHFHLHLSSTGFSQCSPTPPPDASQNDLKSSRVASVELNDISVGSKDKTCSEMGLNLGGRNFLPLNSVQKSMEDVGPQCPSNYKISATHKREKYNVKYPKATDMTAAAELSIAASEALVIHEIVRRGFVADALPTEVVLEAALRVKKARLEWSVDALDSLADETDESDSLSDLDDLMMADAYEDVGLSHSIPFDDCTCGSAISLVKETPLSEQQHEFVNLCDPVELGAPQVEFDDVSAQRQLSENMVVDISKDNVPATSFNHEREEFYDNLVPGLNTCNVSRYNHLALKNSDVLARKQTIGPSVVDVTSYQPKKVDIHPHAWNSGNARDGRVSYLVSDRFRSRWLGGWTGQEVSAVGHMGQNAKSIVKCFAGETSFLSESADIAPDMNSFVQVHETESHRMSQSSIHFGLLPGEANKGILLSQDVVRSSSLSLVDPLCSVVPCSIPSENEVPTLAQTQRDKERHTEKCFRPTTELGMGNLHKSSNLIIEDGQATPAINGEDSPVTVRRQFFSLKTYSTLLPNPVSNGGSLYQSIKLDCDQRLIALDQNVGCIRSSDRSRKESLPLKPISRHLSSRDSKENDKMISNRTPVVKKKYLKRKYNETIGDGNQLPVQASKKRRQSVSSNHRAHCHLQASKSFVNNSTGEKLPKLALVAENVVELQQNKEPQSIPSEHKSLHCRDVPAKKRVHFFEAEIPVQQNKNPKVLDFFTKNWLTDRASKKRKYSNYSKFENHEKCWRTNSHVKARKRLLFQGIQFLLTGFSRQKEKDLEGKIWKHGGIVLFDIPSPNSRANRSLRSNGYQLPIILCSKKLQTTKFLYGCAVNAFILKDDWLTNSISADYIVPPEQYIILRNEAAAEHISIGKPFCHKRDYVFDKVGIMLHGKQSFCCRLVKIIKHGGGKVFKTLQRLILDLEKEKISWGAIVSEDEKTSRHLRHCAAEQKIPIMPASWIIKSLHLGKRLPFSDAGPSSSPVLTISGPSFHRMSEDV